MTNHTAITEHYSANGNLLRQVEEFLSQSEGRSPSPVDLAALDQFHVGGLEATAALAALLAPAKGMQVLDVGSGVGGPSRYLATHYRCHVSGIDMVPVYCEVASLLAERMNLHTLVDYGVGDAVRLPFSDRSFDAVWTQHVSMNIGEKREFYEGIARVLKSGGRFALHDVVASEGGPLRFPVPWARSATQSHLQTGDEMRETILQSGFSLIAWNDVTGSALQFLDVVLARSRSTTPALGLHLLLGPNFPQMASNFRTNLLEDRGGVIQAVFKRVA